MARTLIPRVAQRPAPWLPGDQLSLREAWLHEHEGELVGFVRETLSRRPLPEGWPDQIPVMLDERPGEPIHVALAMLWRLQVGDEDWSEDLVKGVAEAVMGGRIPWEGADALYNRADRLLARVEERHARVCLIVPMLLERVERAQRRHPAGSLPVLAASARVFAAVIVLLELAATVLVLERLLGIVTVTWA